jgi:polyhydroxyalkanoate synthase
MAWDADATRMPYRMHSQYLRRLFLQNDLANGRYGVNSRPVALVHIKVSIFSVGTEQDHIAPWRSVYKIHLLSATEITFVLTNGGHNAGIVSEPGHQGRHYRVHTAPEHEPYRAPDDWYASVQRKDGSGWPEWLTWLRAHSSDQVKPPAMGNREVGLAPLDDAPGRYVHEM